MLMVSNNIAIIDRIVPTVAYLVNSLKMFAVVIGVDKYILSARDSDIYRHVYQYRELYLQTIH